MEQSGLTKTQKELKKEKHGNMTTSTGTMTPATSTDGGISNISSGPSEDEAVNLSCKRSRKQSGNGSKEKRRSKKAKVDGKSNGSQNLSSSGSATSTLEESNKKSKRSRSCSTETVRLDFNTTGDSAQVLIVSQSDDFKSENSVSVSKDVATLFQSVVIASSENLNDVQGNDNFLKGVLNGALNCWVGTRQQAEQMVKGEMQKVKCRNVDLEEKIGVLQDNMKGLEMQLEKVKNELGETQRIKDLLEKELVEQKITKESLTQVLDDCTKNKNALSFQLEETQKKLEALTASHSALQKLKKQKDEEIANHVSKNSELNIKMQEQVTKTSLNKEEADKWQKAFYTMKNNAKKAQDDSRSLKTRVEKLQNELMCLTNERDKLKTEKEELEALVTSKNYSESRLQSEKRKLEQELGKQKEKCENFNQNIISLRSSMGKQAEEIVGLKGTVSNLNEQLKEMGRVNEDLMRNHHQIFNIILKTKPYEHLNIMQKPV